MNKGIGLNHKEKEEVEGGGGGGVKREDGGMRMRMSRGSDGRGHI